MSAAEQRELYLLRRYCGLSPTQVMHELPAWEIELYLAGINADAGVDVAVDGDEPPGDTEDAFAEPPPYLRNT